MSRHLFRPMVGLLVLTLVGCAWPQVTQPTQQAAQASSRADRITAEGTMQRAGISIYMEGTHRLVLNDGRFILLESDTLDLNTYIGRKVQVRGVIRPTVEAGGRIMIVEDVESVATSSSSLSSSLAASGSSVSSATASGATASSVSVISSSSSSSSSSQPVSSSSVSSSVAPASSASSSSKSVASSSAPLSSSKSSVASSSASVASSISSAPAASQDDPFSLAVQAMQKHDMSAGSWTQQYCSSHIEFCMPVHKLWYYKSFGATTSFLWHVELSAKEINALGDGPIVINLVSGTAAAKQATDGQVRTQGDIVMGFKNWGSNEHFEVSAPAGFDAAVRYIIENIGPYVVSQ